MKKEENSTLNQALDSLLPSIKTQQDFDEVYLELHKRLLQRMLDSELRFHLGYEKSAYGEKATTNRRNGSYDKIVQTAQGEFQVQVPRDREGTFEPEILPKYQKRWNGFDDKIIALYSHGMSIKDIQSELKNEYSIDVSAGLISEVTNEVLAEVEEWRTRSLEEIYPILFLDCIVVKCRDNGVIKNKAVYLALAINMEGQKELIGMYISENEGSKFWLDVITQLHNRGVKDILIACVDGLKGFPEAIHSVFPNTQVQCCIVHQIRNSMKYVSYKDYKEVSNDLKPIYNAPDVRSAEIALNDFAAKWDDKYPSIAKQWRANWENLITCFEYTAEIRRVIYTTNAIESMNHSLRKILKTKGVFPNDDSIYKILYLSLKRISTHWTMPIKLWKSALNQLIIKFGDRIHF